MSLIGNSSIVSMYKICSSWGRNERHFLTVVFVLVLVFDVVLVVLVVVMMVDFVMVIQTNKKGNHKQTNKQTKASMGRFLGCSKRGFFALLLTWLPR